MWKCWFGFFLRRFLCVSSMNGRQRRTLFWYHFLLWFFFHNFYLLLSLLLYRTLFFNLDLIFAFHLLHTLLRSEHFLPTRSEICLRYFPSHFIAIPRRYISWHLILDCLLVPIESWKRWFLLRHYFWLFDLILWFCIILLVLDIFLPYFHILHKRSYLFFDWYLQVISLLRLYSLLIVLSRHYHRQTLLRSIDNLLQSQYLTEIACFHLLGSLKQGLQFFNDALCNTLHVRYNQLKTNQTKQSSTLINILLYVYPVKKRI